MRPVGIHPHEISPTPKYALRSVVDSRAWNTTQNPSRKTSPHAIENSFENSLAQLRRREDIFNLSLLPDATSGIEVETPLDNEPLDVETLRSASSTWGRCIIMHADWGWYVYSFEHTTPSAFHSPSLPHVSVAVSRRRPCVMV